MIMAMARRICKLFISTNCVIFLCVYFVLMMTSDESSRVRRVNMMGILDEVKELALRDSSVALNQSDISSGAEERRLSSLPLCPQTPPFLKGPLSVVLTPITMAHLAANHSELTAGGAWRPADCRARHHVAIIIPYRNRENDLQQLLRHIHPILQRQQLDYAIYVIELAMPTKFNRASLMNIGFVESNKESNYSCHIFHDVDLLPEDDRAIYGCSNFPKHMSSALSRHDYRLLYSRLIGGATAMKPDHFRQINGFSNKYFGWGGEDDDLYQRLEAENLPITRNSKTIARYYSRKNAKDALNKKNPKRHKLLRDARQRMKTDGLNSLYYERIFMKKLPLYTWIYVNINRQII